MDERWAEMKPGRSRRTDAPEPVETKTGGIDAFPRNGVAGPGCQAATVADGRRETKTGALRWRKSTSCKNIVIRMVNAVVISDLAAKMTVDRENKKQGVIA